MQPDDPRHGTYAGWQRHKVTPGPTCGPCSAAYRRYAKRMKLRLLTTGSNVVPLGEVAHGLLRTYPNNVIERAIGMPAPMLWRLRNGGPATEVLISTRGRILDLADAGLWTTVGIVRRVRALSAIGYSGTAIARDVGMSRQAMAELIRGDVVSVHLSTGDAIAAAYADLAMTPAPRSTPRERAIDTRARNLAAKNGWAPPLAWDNIDDPTEQPKGKRRSRDDKQSLYEVDEMVVERFLEGDYGIRTSFAEKHVIAEQWQEKGRSLRELARLTGWKVDRYSREAS